MYLPRSPYISLHLEMQVAALQKVGLEASEEASSGAQLLAAATERAARAEAEVGLLRAQLEEQEARSRAEGLAANTALA